MSAVKLVGILNITPDSFSGDGMHNNIPQAMAQADALYAHGASYVDVGAEATNPKAKPITTNDEWERLAPVFARLVAAHPYKISLDTYHPEIITQAVAHVGPKFIANDVTGMNNPEMQAVVATHGLTCIVSHLPERFGTDIQQAHANADMDDAAQVLYELLRRRDELQKRGLASERIILDPGIGFGKTMRLNWELLQFASFARNAGVENEVMIGYSHKRFLGENRFDIAPNLNAAQIAIDSGAKYLRVHEVKEHFAYIQSLA